MAINDGAVRATLSDPPQSVSALGDTRVRHRAIHETAENENADFGIRTRQIAGLKRTVNPGCPLLSQFSPGKSCRMNPADSFAEDERPRPPAHRCDRISAQSCLDKG